MNDGSSGYPLEAYMNNPVNFRFAVYDRDGKILEASDDWSEEAFKSDEKKYYYIVDMNDLRIFDNVNNIRVVRFANRFLNDDKAEQ